MERYTNGRPHSTVVYAVLEGGREGGIARLVPKALLLVVLHVNTFCGIEREREREREMCVGIGQ